jgi:ABC-2 type transport system permease protein
MLVWLGGGLSSLPRQRCGCGVETDCPRVSSIRRFREAETEPAFDPVGEHMVNLQTLTHSTPGPRRGEVRGNWGHPCPGVALGLIAARLDHQTAQAYGRGPIDLGIYAMDSMQAPLPRRLGRVNWLGLWTLYLKEVRRFVKVSTQTVLAPLITTLLFLAIFTLALGRAVTTVGGVPFAEFLGPGLIMMAMVQNAFANTSSSLLISKVQGNIVDVLMPPLSPFELTFGFAAGGMSRGLVVGLAVGLVMWTVVPIHIHNAFFVLFHAVAASLLLSLLGMLGGIWSEKFDHMAAVTNFVITPLAFLSGTFYSVDRLPGAWLVVAHLNPFFYMIDGFRYGFIGHADGSLAAGLAVMIAINAALALLTWRAFAVGYKLKA